MNTDSSKQQAIVNESISRTLNKLAYNAQADNLPVIYLSGPMTGLPAHNFSKFNELAKHFRNLYYFVFNPAENFNGVTNLAYEVHFLEDVIQLLFCTHIHMIEGWENSRGAYCEYLLARRLDLIFVDKNGLRIDPPPAPETVMSYNCLKKNYENLKNQYCAVAQAYKMALLNSCNEFKPDFDLISFEKLTTFTEVFPEEFLQNKEVKQDLVSSSTQKVQKEIDNKFQKEVKEYKDAMDQMIKEERENSIYKPFSFEANKQADMLEGVPQQNAQQNINQADVYIALQSMTRQRDKAEQELAVLRNELNNLKADNCKSCNSVKESLAEQSLNIVNKSRSKQYGDPKDDFNRTVGMMNSLGYRFIDANENLRLLEAYDFPIMMNLVKLSRLVNTINKDYFHSDSVLDCHGYLNTLEMLYNK